MVSRQTSKVLAQTQPRSMVLVRWRRTRAVRYDTCSWCATGTILQEFVIRTAVRPIFASLLALQATGTTPFRVENASVVAWTGQSAWPVEAQGCVQMTDVSTDAQDGFEAAILDRYEIPRWRLSLRGWEHVLNVFKGSGRHVRLCRTDRRRRRRGGTCNSGARD